MPKKYKSKKKLRRQEDKENEAFLSALPHLFEAMEEITPRLINTALQIPDQAMAETCLTNLVAYAWTSLHGQSIGETKAHLEFLEADLEDIDAIIRDAKKKKRETPKWFLSNPRHQNRADESLQPVPFKDWSLRHQLEYPMLWIALPIMLAASFFSARAALLASGLPAYLEDPIFLTSAIACLPGFGSLAGKSMGSLFRTDKGQNRFAFTVYGLAITTLGIWGACFADQFHGTGGGSLDIFSDGTGVWKEKLFVGSQIACEMLLGTAFFVKIERISKIYDADSWFRNLEHTEQDKTIKRESDNRLSLRDVTAEHRGKKLSQDAALNLQVEIALTSFRAKRARGDEPTL